MRPGEITGLAEHAESIWTSEEMLRLRAAFADVRDRAGRGERVEVLFLVPPEQQVRRPAVRDGLHARHVASPRGRAGARRSYIQAFGPRLHEVVESEFAERGIEGHTTEVVEEVVDGEVPFAEGVVRPYDTLVSFPPYVAAVTYDGLPHDDRGFLATDPETRQVEGHPDIYAPGDAGDFPVKQAFLAFLQADATAEHIAGRVQGREPRAAFDPGCAV